MNARRLLSCLAVSVLSIGAALPALAFANRVFVSARSGNNANACDNVNTPCQTFAGAVTQFNPDGEVIVLDSGGYGPVTITQGLTIEAPPGVLAFIHPPSGDAITINAGATDTVVLRGLVLNGGAGRGIIVNTVGTVHVENCVISGFSGHGLFILAAGSSAFVEDTISRQNGQNGAVFENGRASVDHCRFEGNAGDGVFVQSADVTVRDSLSAGNGWRGFEAPFQAILNLYQCMSTNNGRDGISAGNLGVSGVLARVANSSMSENIGVGLHNLGGTSTTLVSLGNNFAEGNIGGPASGAITTVLPH